MPPTFLVLLAALVAVQKGDPPAAHDQLRAMLRSWMESIDDPLLVDW